MFSNIFSNSPIVWLILATGLAALPILIHLINHWRYPRVRWAAMQFLLVSHRRHSSAAALKQVLLIAARICLLLIALLLLGRVSCDDPRMAGWPGSPPMHHYILLDDSVSLAALTTTRSSHSSGDRDFRFTTPWERVQAAAMQIAKQASQTPGDRVTLLRFSHAKAAALGLAHAKNRQGQSENELNESRPDLSDVVFDLDDVPADEKLVASVEQLLRTARPSSMACEPNEALSILQEKFSEQFPPNSRVYVLSDFRARAWQNNPQAFDQCFALAKMGCDLQMLICADEHQPNLAVTKMQIVSSVTAAKVPITIAVHVANFGQSDVADLTVPLRWSRYEAPPRNWLGGGNELTSHSTATSTDSASDFGSNASSAALVQQPTDLPPLKFDRIKTGEVAVQQVTIGFPEPGHYIVEASLPDDSLAADNIGRCVVSIRPYARALLVDNPSKDHSSFVRLCLGASHLTGVMAEDVTFAALRETDLTDLLQYDSVYMFDPPQLDQAAIDLLRNYVKGGGGLIWFVGPNADPAVYDQHYHLDGHGVWPLSLGTWKKYSQDDAKSAVYWNDQRISTPFRANHQWMDYVRFEHVLELSEISQSNDSDQAAANLPLADTNAAYQTVAMMDGDPRRPLIVTKPLGKGQVVAICTTAAPRWNNWARNPTFPILILTLHHFAAEQKNASAWHHAGNRIEFSLPSPHYQDQAELFSPLPDGDSLRPYTLLGAVDPDHHQVTFQMLPHPGASGELVLPDAGLHHATIHLADGTREDVPIAIHSDPTGSDLALADRAYLKAVYADANPRWVQHEQFTADQSNRAVHALTVFLIVGMISLLLAEQWLAMRLSYHSPRRAVG